jgi:GTPase SAR1 family protein
MRHRFNLEDKTREFLDFIFPSTEVITNVPERSYDMNHIISRNIVVYGSMGIGKTELVRALVEKAVERYGEDNVDALVSEDGDLEEAIYSLCTKLVQIIFLDNFTLKEIPKASVREYFKIRHIWLDFLKRVYPEKPRNYGYILSIFGLHRYHSTIPEFRTNIDAIIAKSSTINPYDRNVLRGLIGEEGLQDLEYIDRYAIEDPSLKSISVFSTKHARGLLIMPLAKKNYLQAIETIS